MSSVSCYSCPCFPQDPSIFWIWPQYEVDWKDKKGTQWLQDSNEDEWQTGKFSNHNSLGMSITKGGKIFLLLGRSCGSRAFWWAGVSTTDFNSCVRPYCSPFPNFSTGHLGVAGRAMPWIWTEEGEESNEITDHEITTNALSLAFVIRDYPSQNFWVLIALWGPGFFLNVS